MSRELVNRISFKKDGVYVSTHSSNDIAPYHSTKLKNVSEVYLKEGRGQAERILIEIFLNNVELRGNNPSIIPYKKALEDYYNNTENVNLNKIREYEDILYGFRENTLDLTREELKKKIINLKAENEDWILDKVLKYRNDEYYRIYAICKKEENETEQITFPCLYMKEDLDRGKKQIEKILKAEDIIKYDIIQIKDKLLCIAESIIEKALDETLNGNYIYDLKNENLEKEDYEDIRKYIESDEKIADLEITEDGELDIICYLDYCKNMKKNQEDEEELEP